MKTRSTKVGPALLDDRRPGRPDPLRAGRALEADEAHDRGDLVGAGLDAQMPEAFYTLRIPHIPKFAR